MEISTKTDTFGHEIIFKFFCLLCHVNWGDFSKLLLFAPVRCRVARGKKCFFFVNLFYFNSARWDDSEDISSLIALPHISRFCLFWFLVASLQEVWSAIVKQQWKIHKKKKKVWLMFKCEFFFFFHFILFHSHSVLKFSYEHANDLLMTFPEIKFSSLFSHLEPK